MAGSPGHADVATRPIAWRGENVKLLSSNGVLLTIRVIKMNTFTNAQPNAIVTEFGCTTFYFDVKPHGMYRLPAYSEFKLVYSPSDVQGWEAVRYRVSQNKKGYYVIDRQPLLPNEIAYFESLLEGASPTKA